MPNDIEIVALMTGALAVGLLLVVAPAWRYLRDRTITASGIVILLVGVGILLAPLVSRLTVEGGKEGLKISYHTTFGKSLGEALADTFDNPQAIGDLPESINAIELGEAAVTQQSHDTADDRYDPLWKVVHQAPHGTGTTRVLCSDTPVQYEQKFRSPPAIVTSIKNISSVGPATVLFTGAVHVDEAGFIFRFCTQDDAGDAKADRHVIRPDTRGSWTAIGSR